MFIVTKFTQKVQIITNLSFSYVKIGYFVRKIQTSQVNNSIILWIRNVKFSYYRFLNKDEHLQGDFQMHYCTFKGNKGKKLDVQSQIIPGTAYFCEQFPET